MTGDSSLIQNITKLEVNTIIKDSMTARKMPDPANAILDIALAYVWKMSDLGIPVGKWLKEGTMRVPPPATQEPEAIQEYFRELQCLAEELAEKAACESETSLRPDGSGRAPEPNADDVCIDVPTFLRIRWAAATAVSAYEGVDRMLLERIRKNADQLKNLLWRLHTASGFGSICGKNRTTLNTLDAAPTSYRDRDILKLEPPDATMLRKIWEIGVEEVVAQTTIDLDGDTVTRIGRRCVGPGRSHVISLHRLGIETAVGYWTGIIEALGTFITNLAGRIGRGD